MSDVDTLDVGTLAPYLEAHVEDFKAPMTAEKFSGGQSNPTFRIRAASGDYVLRRQPPGKLLKSAHAVDREFRVMRALATSAVPVPQVYHLCEDRDVLGSMFFLMELCQGPIYWDAALPEVDKPRRSAMYDEMNRVLAMLHDVDVAAVGLSDYGKPGNYFERQVGRWSKQYRVAEIDRIEPMEQLMAWVQANLPADDGQVSLVHGDYRLDNMVWQEEGASVRAVLDWELSTLGHPLADLAYQCMQLRLPSQGGHLRGLGGVERAALGIPSEAAYVAAYCKRRGISHVDHWEFYLAFSFFRLAAICQGIAKRAVEGNASSKQAAWAATLVEPLAAMAMQIVREGV